MSTQIKKNGNWVTVAGGTRMWVGTKAALQAALDAGELVDGTAVMVTDDYEEISLGHPKPDWANAVEITAAQLQAGYTAPSDGMIVGIAWVTDEKPFAEIQVNGVTVAIAKTSNIAQIQCPVEQGNTLSTSKSVAGSKLKFVPWK